METTTASSSYVGTIIVNLHIQMDTMMEEIHLDTSCPAAAPTAFYSNGNGNNNNRHRNNNRRYGVVVTRTVTMVETAVATPPTTPPWFPTASPPTTTGVPCHGRRL
jgi:hypothetical protein